MVYHYFYHSNYLDCRRARIQ